MQPPILHVRKSSTIDKHVQKFRLIWLKFKKILTQISQILNQNLIL